MWSVSVSVGPISVSWGLSACPWTCLGVYGLVFMSMESQGLAMCHVVCLRVTWSVCMPMDLILCPSPLRILMTGTFIVV